VRLVFDDLERSACRTGGPSDRHLEGHEPARFPHAETHRQAAGGWSVDGRLPGFTRSATRSATSRLRSG